MLKWGNIGGNQWVYNISADLLNNIKHYKKLNYDEFCREEFRRKEYFFHNDLETVRTLFRLSSRMLETVRGDFPHKYRRKSLVCPSCRTEDVSHRTISQSLEEGPIDSLEHIKVDCYAFRDLRSKYDLSDDKQLAQFFNSVVEQRKERGEDWVLSLCPCPPAPCGCSALQSATAQEEKPGFKS